MPHPSVAIHQGDCLEILPTLAADSVDAVVTDPPAGIGFMGKAWDRATVMQDMLPAALRECLRVAKPGARLLCWAIPRTSHWTGLAIEAAGWEIQDRITHVFGSGFPKHKSKLKPAAEDWWLATKPGGKKWLGVDECRIPVSSNDDIFAKNPCTKGGFGHAGAVVYGKSSGAPVYDTSAGRWPANFVLSHHEECRQVGERTVKGDRRGDPGGKRDGGFFAIGSDNGDGKPNARVYGDETIGVWECHPECAVRLLDEQSGISKGSAAKRNRSPRSDTTQYRAGGSRYGETTEYDDRGGASRFFYCAKASRRDRNEGCEGLELKLLRWSNGDQNPGSFQSEGTDKTAANHHPTVKPADLMRWLCRLACPPGGTILDPFMGSGSTGKACVAEGFGFIGIDQDPEYVEIARRRIAFEQSKMPLLNKTIV